MVNFPQRLQLGTTHGLDLTNLIWKLDVMPKLKMFIWRLCHKSLPTRGNWMKTGMSIDQLYPFCQRKIKDANHLFLNYTITQYMWALTSAHNWTDTPCFAGSQRGILRMLSHLRATLKVSILDRVVGF